jgi:hypothetical protein
MTKTKRPRLVDAAQPVGMFAVMRHPSQGLTSARFVCVHESEDTAMQEARRFAGESVEKYGVRKAVCYYVVKIVNRVGILGGKPEGHV